MIVNWLNMIVNWLITQGVIPGGLGGGGWGEGCDPPNFWPTTLFSGFSHTTDRKVPSEVVLTRNISVI